MGVVLCIKEGRKRVYTRLPRLVAARKRCPDYHIWEEQEATTLLGEQQQQGCLLPKGRQA